MAQLLRPTRKAQLVSADVFESLFQKNLNGYVEITSIDVEEWCQQIFGQEDSRPSLKNAAENFFRYTEGYDYFCPGYELIPLSYIFMELRNRSRADIRLLLIAHAPGAYVMEWAMLRPLLVPGDLIIAPSKSGKETITFLIPELSPFIHVIHHPMSPLPVTAHSDKRDTKDLIVTLSRIDKGKLIHRQIEAMEILRNRGYSNLSLEVAGPLENPATGELTPYARSLSAMITRLKLEEHVKLVGGIYTDCEKARFLSRAKMLLYLSITVEEAYPKSSIEALGVGIPVVATHWDGFLETVGKAGKLVPIRDDTRNGHVDVHPHDVADAIEQLLHHAPPAHQCREQAGKFHPQYMAVRYGRILQESLKERKSLHFDTLKLDSASAAPRGGLLARNSLLRSFLWKELFALSLEYIPRIRRVWKGEIFSSPLPFQIFHQLLMASTQKSVERFLSKVRYDRSISSFGNDMMIDLETTDFFEKLFSGVAMDTTPESKEICLLACQEAGRIDLLEKGLSFLYEYDHRSFGITYLTIELFIEQKKWDSALQLLNDMVFSSEVEEFHHIFLRQFAKIGRKMGQPGIALAQLQMWLDHYPDSPDSGPIWLDLAINAANAGEECLPTAKAAFLSAKKLLGELPILSRIEQAIQRKSLLSLIENNANTDK